MEKMEDLIIDYVEGNLKGELKEHVEKTLAKSEKWRAEYEELSQVMKMMDESPNLQPNDTLRADFEAMLLAEQPETKVVQMQPAVKTWWYQTAAAIALLIIGGLSGVLLTRNQQAESDLAALKSEMELTRQLVMSSLENESSATSRLQGVNVSYSLTSLDDEILTALFNTLEDDKNTNVRLAALDALTRFIDEPEVKAGLIRSMETQTDPVVTIQLINVMVGMKESEAIAPMQKLLESEEVDQVVKDEAHLGIMKLS